MIPAMSVHDGDPLGALLMVECAMRCRGKTYELPRHLMFAAGADAGYSIDAPRYLPGGGCVQDEFENELFPSQIMIDRESITAAPTS